LERLARSLLFVAPAALVGELLGKRFVRPAGEGHPLPLGVFASTLDDIERKPDIDLAEWHFTRVLTAGGDSCAANGRAPGDG
jgi:hypothetical protein